MNQNHSTRRPNAALIWVVALAGSALAIAPAHAQNALGDGRVLDANPGQGGRYNAARPSFAQELQFRNAIVTGNAPGGLSFRGDLGYRAAGEFIGDIGSDELFSFRRDSLYSGLAGMGIRGTDALQYQFSLTTGARPPQNIMGDLSIARDAETRASAAYGSAPASTGISRNPNDLDTRGLGLYLPSVQEYELADAMTGSMRSASSYISTTNLSPVIISTFEQGYDRDRFGLTSSVLTGVTTSPLHSGPPDARRPGERGTNDRAGRDGDARGARDGLGMGAANTRVDTSARPGGADGPRGLTAYDEVVERLRTRAAEQAERMNANERPERAPTVTERLEAIRNSMMGTTPPGQPGQPNQSDPSRPGAQPGNQPGNQSGNQGGNQAGDNAPERSARPNMGVTNPSTPPAGATAPSSAPGRTNTGQTIPGVTNPGATNPNPMPREAEVDDRDQPALRPGARFDIDPETLELIRVDPTPLASFVDPSADTRDIYSEHMRTGERLIASERYFDAEERFARALSMRPGEPTAQVGRAHSQLGAGLLLSASVNLRTIFVTHPELLGARYAGRLLPAPDRIDTLIENLRFRAGLAPIEGIPPEADGARVAAAFLLAYLGHQNNRPEIIEQGLGIMDEIGADDDRRLANILRQVWLQDAPIDAELIDAMPEPDTSGQRVPGLNPPASNPRDDG